MNKKRIYNKLKKSYILIILLFQNELFSQQVLSKMNASWTTVLPGVVICEPVETSYGFCIATDARNVIGYSKEGIKLWEKQIGRSKRIELSVIKNDFLLIHEINDNRIKVINQSGNEIWSKQLEFIPREKVLVGYDGRFFLYSENSIYCFGIDGKCKWKIDTLNQKKIPIQQLPDGSLVYFLSENEVKLHNKNQNKTIGIRISPFGEEIEEIFFSGRVTKSSSCKDGILVSFQDGSAGLFSVQDGFAINKWVLQKQSQNGVFLVSNDLQNYYYLELDNERVVINQINYENGTINNYFVINSIKGNKIIKMNCNNTGFFLCDENISTLYDYDFNELFFGKMPNINQQNWNYIFTLNDNYFIFCNKDWSLCSFQLHQNIGKEYTIESKQNYNSFYKYDLEPFAILHTKDFGTQLTNDKRITLLKNGFYGDYERIYLSEVISICNLYINQSSIINVGSRKEDSIFDLDIKGFQNILLQLSLFCDDNTQNIASKVIKTKDRNYSFYLLNNLSGYDPDGQLLYSLEKIMEQVSSNDIAYINSVCDLVYRICSFMGRPAYNTKGKKILKNFMNPNYNIKNRKYASDTLKKIMELDL